jgi:hypothetical protein
MQKLAGHVVDEDGFELEIWTDQGPDQEISHVFIMYGGTELGDFPFNSPDKGCELCEAAQLVAGSPLTTTISLPILVMSA